MKRAVVWIMSFLLLTSSVCISASGAEERPQESWVNWYPSGWENDPIVAETAAQIINSSTQEELPYLIHRWICKNIFYDIDAERQGVYYALAAKDVISQRRSVCEGIANLTQGLFINAGIPCIKVWGVSISSDETWNTSNLNLEKVNHTWNEYYWKGRWYPIDCTMDMGNRYENGRFIETTWDETYFAPDRSFFEKTHLCLQRGFDYPENIPDRWAWEEIKSAVCKEVVPLVLLQNYRAPVTREEFGLLVGEHTEGCDTITRLEAAMILAKKRNITVLEAPSPYRDVSICSDEERSVLGTLYYSGIMVGNDQCFFPSELLSRQEAIVIVSRLREREEMVCT